MARMAENSRSCKVWLAPGQRVPTSWPLIFARGNNMPRPRDFVPVRKQAWSQKLVAELQLVLKLGQQAVVRQSWSDALSSR